MRSLNQAKAAVPSYKNSSNTGVTDVEGFEKMQDDSPTDVTLNKDKLILIITCAIAESSQSRYFDL